MSMRRTIKKLFWGVVITTLALFFAFKLSLPLIAGGWKYSPSTLKLQGSTTSEQMILKAFIGINNPVDYHVHVLGTDASPQTYINPSFTSLLHPSEWTRYQIFMHASGVTDLSKSWDQYLSRLTELMESMPEIRYHVLAFDLYHNKEGEPDLAQSDFYVSNQRIFELSEQEEHLEPVISVHPLKKNALKELEKWSKRDVHLVKWLPNAMNIDPSDPRLKPFYQKMKELDMALLTHTGKELAVSSEHQSYGNPLLYRQALEIGTTVIMAHSATYGDCEDLDNEGQEVACFDLFLRLLEEPKYKDNLLGDISSVYYFNRDLKFLKTLLKRTDLHKNLVNGSDYPLPAVNLIAPLGRLKDAKLLTANEARALKEIYLYNPLLFDFVLKRTLKHPETKKGFQPIVFEQRNVKTFTLPKL